MLNTSQFQGVHRLLKAEGGYTVNPASGRVVREGWAVADRPHEARLLAQHTEPADLEAYAQEKSKPLSAPGAHLGGWENRWTSPPEAVLDVSRVYSEMRPAYRRMLQERQQSMFNLGTRQEVFNPLHPENHPLKAAAIPAEHRKRRPVRRIKK